MSGKTWAALTNSTDEKPAEAAAAPASPGWSDFGGQRYQQLVPSFTTMFPFFLAMVVGWVFVTERRQGTLKRLRFAPVSRAEILAGKLLPVFVLSMGLAAFLLLAGRLIFQMTLGAGIVAVVGADRLAAAGGHCHVVRLDGAGAAGGGRVAQRDPGGAVRRPAGAGDGPGERLHPAARDDDGKRSGDRAGSRRTAGRLAAYRELLGDDPKYVPDLGLVWQACGVLTAFGAAFLGLAWWLLRLD